MTPEQLKNVTPAPWVVDAPGCVGHHFKEGGKRTIAVPGGRYSAGRNDIADAEFIALARNAFDVMMRRGWFVIPLGFDGPSNHWRVEFGKGKCPRWVFDYQPQNDHPDPFTALVEADAWYRANIEKESA